MIATDMRHKPHQITRFIGYVQNSDSSTSITDIMEIERGNKHHLTPRQIKKKMATYCHVIERQRLICRPAEFGREQAKQRGSSKWSHGALPMGYQAGTR